MTVSSSMALKVYSKYCREVVFGNGPLGVTLGKTEDGFPIVKDYERRNDGTLLPLEVDSSASIDIIGE